MITNNHRQPILQQTLDVFADVLGEAAVVWPELVRDPF